MSNRQKLNAAARREAARIEAEKLAKKQRRNRLLVILGAAVLVIAIVAAGYIIWQGSRATYLDDVERTPPGSDSSGGIPVSAEGVAGVENPTAPRLDVYIDFMSPESVTFWQLNGADVQALATSGAVSLWIHPVGIVDGGTNGFSTRAAQAAVVVAQKSPDLFLNFITAEVDMLAGGAEHLNDPDLVTLAQDVGIPQEVSDTFDDNLFNEWCVAASEQAERDGYSTTPTLLLDGSQLAGNWTSAGAVTTAVTDALGPLPTPTEAATS